MKHSLIFLLSVLCLFSPVNGQSSDQNYIRTIVPCIEMTDASSVSSGQALKTIQYYDGLGRLTQIVAEGVTPQSSDLVSIVEYDAAGRVSKEWLPVPMNGTASSYREPSAVKSGSSTFYDGDPFAYIQTEYDASPLNRVVKKIGPGSEWFTNDKAQRMEYLANTATGDLAIPYYIVDGNRLERKGFYPAGALTATVSRDEDNTSYYDFTDKEGKRVHYKRVSYVYDDMGHLLYVIPPFWDGSPADGIIDTAPGSDLYKAGYIYTYDSRGNCITKKLPSIEPIYYVYDKADRLVLAQTPNQRARNEWSFTKYDVFSRVILSGTTIINNKTHDQLRAEYKQIISKETFTGSFSTGCYGYSNTTLPTGNLTILKADYYDDYGFKSSSNLDNYMNYQSQNGFTSSCETLPLGLHTGSMAKTFDTGTLIYNVFYYDRKGRLIQQKSNNLIGGYDGYYTSYNFVGEPVEFLHIHSSSSVSSLTERYLYTYDHSGRLLTTSHSLNGGAAHLITRNSYDELGRLQRKTLPANLDEITYSYTVRGQLSQLHSKYYQQTNHYGFWFKMRREFGRTYNGDPTGMTYSTKYRDPDTHSLKETEVMNMHYLYSGDYLINSSTVDFSGSSPEHDHRYSESGGARFYGNFVNRSYKSRSVDNIYVSCFPYQVESAYEEGCEDVSFFPIQFAPKEPTEMNPPYYLYDGNGNLYLDRHHGIANIDYNLLNLPNSITFDNGSDIRYRYDADGVKYRADYTTAFNETLIPVGCSFSANSAILRVDNHTDYCGNLIYENNVLKKIRIDGGYINYNSSTGGGEYCYYIQDQIGNNRVILSETRGVIQYADYYPFGIPYSEIPMEEDNFLHAGKEFEKMHGLYWYDNGKRWYDPILCRFTTMDPLCEKYYDKNPYSYCADNPMRYGDANGDSIWFTSQMNKNNELIGITMHVTGKVMDASNSVNMKSAIKNISSGIQRAFKGNIDGVSFNTDVQLSEAKSMNEVENSDHLFVLTDKIIQPNDGHTYGMSNDFGSKVAFIEAGLFSGLYDRALGSRNYGTYTAVHEFGHLANLEHVKKNNFNLMTSNGFLYNLNSDQLKHVYYSWNHSLLNRGTNYLLTPYGKKIPNSGIMRNWLSR